MFFDDGVSYCYITHSNLVLMAVSRTNANAAAVLLFLHKLRDILTTYFGELEEESLRDNFVIAYELLDEARLCLLQLLVRGLCFSCTRKHGLLQKQLCKPFSLRLPLVQVMDFGWVQFTEAKILSEYIKTDAYKMEVSHHAAHCWGLVHCISHKLAGVHALRPHVSLVHYVAANSNERGCCL